MYRMHPGGMVYLQEVHVSVSGIVGIVSLVSVRLTLTCHVYDLVSFSTICVILLLTCHKQVKGNYYSAHQHVFTTLGLQLLVPIHL